MIPELSLCVCVGQHNIAVQAKLIKGTRFTGQGENPKTQLIRHIDCEKLMKPRYNN